MTDVPGPTRWALLACVLGALALPAAAPAAPVSVNLRVEGRSATIFDGPVTTDGHDVTTASGGTHECDGTNGPTPEPEPGPTATAALDDAGRRAGFSFDGNYGNFGIEDFFLTRVANDTVDESSEYWSLWIDYDFASEGGCQQRVRSGDDVLWGLSPFTDDRALKLSGPTSTRTGQPVTVKVVSRANPGGEPQAEVGGATTGPDGNATLTYSEAGVYRLKAEAENAVRSNSLVLCVDPPGADPCTSADRSAPRAELLTPRFASQISNSRTFDVAWQGDDGKEGSGVAGFSVESRAPGAGWRPLAGRTAAVSAKFRGRAGSSYAFRVRAVDRASNTGAPDTARVVVPVDDRDRARLRFGRGWKRLARRGAWGKHVMRSRREGAGARMTYSGSRVAIIARRLPKGGKLLVTIDGHRKVLNMRGATRHRSLRYLSVRRPGGRHKLELRAAGGGPVEIDAVAPAP